MTTVSGKAILNNENQPFEMETAPPSKKKSKGEYSPLISEGYPKSTTEILEASVEKSTDNGQRSTENDGKLSMSVLHQQNSVPLLSTIQLLGIIFFTVTGGPYGFEDAVGSGGPTLMFLFLFIVPIIWSTPLALMTAELSCMIPETGGHIFWVYRAFGPFWSFLNGVFTLACSIFDTALFPAMFVDYLGYVIYGSWIGIPTVWSLVLKVILVVGATLVNIRGVGIVGTTSLFFFAAVMLPFLFLTLWGLPRLNFNWVHSGVPRKVDWARLLTIILWNTSGFDAAGTCASEVKNPSTSYPRALIGGISIMVFVYAIPTLLGVSVMSDPSLWHDGAYVQVASIIGGQGFGVVMGTAAMLSALGLLLIRLCTNSRLVFGMALIGQVPKKLKLLHPKYATPWLAIVLTASCTLLLSGFSFTSLAEADMVLYAISTTLKFGALVQLRFTEPDAYRPFRIPLGDKTLAGLFIIPMGLCFTMVWVASPRAHLIAIIGLISAIVGYVAHEGLPVGYANLIDFISDKKTKFVRIYKWVWRSETTKEVSSGLGTYGDLESPNQTVVTARDFPSYSPSSSNKRTLVKYFEIVQEGETSSSSSATNKKRENDSFQSQHKVETSSTEPKS